MSPSRVYRDAGQWLLSFSRASRTGRVGLCMVSCGLYGLSLGFIVYHGDCMGLVLCLLLLFSYQLPIK